MFERYTEKARRTIFFARYEASQFGAHYIESEHLLLGLLRENKALAYAVLGGVLGGHGRIDEIWKKVEAHTPIQEKVSTSVDLPLSNECKRVLAYAAEEAERLGHKHIGSEHLLLGLLREQKCFAAAILNEYGITLEKARATIEGMGTEIIEQSGTMGGWTEARSSAPQLHALIEFRVGEKIIGTAPYFQHLPDIGDRVVIAQPLTPGKFDVYIAADITYEYAHAANSPPPLPLRLTKIVVQLQAADSGAQDVE